MYGRVFRKLHTKSKAKGKNSESAGIGSTSHAPLSPSNNSNSNSNKNNDQHHHHPPDESRSRWDEYDSKSADIALFKRHPKATHHPIDHYERSVSHDSIFAMAATPPRANTTSTMLSIGPTTSGQDNDSVDLTIFIDDDQSAATELLPVFRLRPSIVPEHFNEDGEEEKEEDHPNKTDRAVSNDNSTTYRSGTRGCRSSLRRSHSGGLDPYLMPPPRFTRFEI